MYRCLSMIISIALNLLQNIFKIKDNKLHGFSLLSGQTREYN